MKKVHIALDFDKTLFTHESEWPLDKKGEPIMSMVEKVKEWLKNGYKVTIFSARLSHVGMELEDNIKHIRELLKTVGLENLPMTCVKHPYFTHFIDDRAYHVEKNTGKIIGPIDI